MIQDLTVLAITNNQAVHAVEVIKEKKEQAIQVEHQAQEVIEESTAKKTELDTQIQQERAEITQLTVEKKEKQKEFKKAKAEFKSAPSEQKIVAAHKVEKAQKEMVEIEKNLIKTKSAMETQECSSKELETKILKETEKLTQSQQEIQRAEAQETAIPQATAKGNQPKVQKLAEKTKAVKKFIQKKEQKEKELKLKLKQIHQTKEVVQRNKNTDKAELEKVSQTIATAKQEVELSMCQSFFYSLPQ